MTSDIILSCVSGSFSLPHLLRIAGQSLPSGFAGRLPVSVADLTPLSSRHLRGTRFLVCSSQHFLLGHLLRPMGTGDSTHTAAEESRELMECCFSHFPLSSARFTCSCAIHWFVFGLLRPELAAFGTECLCHPCRRRWLSHQIAYVYFHSLIYFLHLPMSVLHIYY